ncbi:uncharacterized protein LOC111704026 isoform X2 [Eurytemora carolleeae]|uniref:uncharacterized protein LOC111704026 isoform X2 n=1 Tax=Eurytemora carolleeae TaxID=1294199 RepID=UPI000C77799A|nr:uncharacterized protein LOC111704026 isoform X2 [Eurytemora carolleeae]|eukprot:XP_023331904.1 uncharacterized protein LOC111704026 isoform X2 [Eurytemora affinis]
MKISILIFFIFLHTSLGCNKRDIVIRGNRLGYKCCGLADQQSDVGDEVSLPPLPPALATSTASSTSTAITTSTSPPPTPIIPVGDCVCGSGIQKKALSSNGTLNRPWAVHVSIESDLGSTIECSGSLLNRKWVISAAHCFCKHIPGVSCGILERGMRKIAPSDVIKSSITLRFGTTAEAKALPPVSDIDKLVVHPDYFESRDLKHGNPYDIALIKTKQDIYTEAGTRKNGIIIVQPICLPPPGPITLEESSEDETNQLDGLKKPSIPFNDMDCKITFGDGIDDPPHTRLEIGWLKCHAAAFIAPLEVEVEGRTSFLTAFGSTKQKNTKVCRANSFSPDQSVFRKCTSECKQSENPSMFHPLCQDLLKSAILDELKNTTVARIVIKTASEDVICYPWKNPSEIVLFEEHPFKAGWCQTECDSSISECKDNSTSWGWCIDGCDKNTPSDFNDNIHEIQVDSFVYENCSRNVDTFTEFCTGSPITRPKQHIVRVEEGEFEMVKTEPEIWHPGNIGWNGNDTIIRPGSRYQGRQHSSVVGDSCFGDAGGSVWKYWRFKDPASNAPVRPDHGTLAVLTGVVSRFEENCGAFQGGEGETDHPNLPTQHTIHARVQQHFSWITKTVFSEASCGIITGSKEDAVNRVSILELNESEIELLNGSGENSGDYSGDGFPPYEANESPAEQELKMNEIVQQGLEGDMEYQDEK